MQKSVQPASAQVTEELPNELKELVRAMEGLPAAQREALRPCVERVVQCSTRRRRILNLVQEALSQLRLDMKYLIFDLEATRRERESLQAELDELRG
ncbi:transcriptional regulator [Roseimaritima sediminicola]|uniref:transcriptional regulator n=1 Tax=Roseimaritima sediminicola TaxID=2662066 RepID=UPI00129840FC|nr:transcriptional regulator [Roseimaritima sediminicola]